MLRQTLQGPHLTGTGWTESATGTQGRQPVLRYKSQGEAQRRPWKSQIPGLVSQCCSERSDHSEAAVMCADNFREGKRDGATAGLPVLPQEAGSRRFPPHKGEKK